MGLGSAQDVVEQAKVGAREGALQQMPCRAFEFQPAVRVTEATVDRVVADGLAMGAHVGHREVARRGTRCSFRGFTGGFYGKGVWGKTRGEERRCGENRKIPAGS